MANDPNRFKRYELKYLISAAQREQIEERIREYVVCDAYGKSTICNIYFDTPNFLLIRRSLESPVYKEKLRLRSYGKADPNSAVFVELKKKYQSVVYKRRVSMAEEKAMRYLCEGKPVLETQIVREIDFFMSRYPTLKPAVWLSYDREAFYGKEDPEFRITFDENILWRETDLSLCAGIYGSPVLQDGQVLMEIKTGMAIPLWMTAVLSEGHIYKTSFSKYGHAYRSLMPDTHLGGICYA